MAQDQAAQPDAESGVGPGPDQVQPELDLGTQFLMEAFDPANRADPYALYARMREESPVLDAGNHLWFTFSYAGANALLRAKQVSSDERRSRGYQAELEAGTIPQHIIDNEQSMLFLDPPDHTRLRGLVNSAFTQRRVERMTVRVQERTDALLDELDGAGPSDLVKHLAYPLPVAVICELLGVPEEDHTQFGAWSHDLTKGLDPGALRTPEDETLIAAAMAELRSYVASLADERRRAPADDLLTALIEARDGDDQMTEGELISMVVLLLVAGHETTVNLIGNGLVAILKNPDQLARWQADPGLTKNAVDEVLRYDSPVQIGMRVTIEPTEVEGVTVPVDEQILILLGAANRDPAMFANPDQLDLGRQNAARNMSFGGGIHHCLGMALARAEGQIVLGSLVSRFSNLQLSDEPVLRERMVLRGYEQIMVDCR